MYPERKIRLSGKMIVQLSVPLQLLFVNIFPGASGGSQSPPPTRCLTVGLTCYRFAEMLDM